ncbi:MurR/RpiR family transcriptional regulator [Peribacillus loiseleuriae]|uniref:RpiR family transcriptional regulator n=1 Tax=Peribacillus loiseleuriae TaxID=1679170 RepID=A0A0K9GXD1_9BACI|nr:MurR/RpiR family transcriptional regulator [Peribacillus loiseleuriae]KMY50917.1 RpiR family transcriptional regulator [Peribacillus loiseleuriae]
MTTNSVNILLRIESVLEELPKSERKIAQYILEHANEIVRMTVHELAANANASSAAVIRLCRSIEVAGFSELKVSLSSQISRPLKSGFYDIEPNETIQSIKEKIVSNSVQVIQETAMELKEEMIDKTVESIRNAEIIYIFGLGASWLVAENMMQKWSRLGKVVIAYQDAHIYAAALAASNQKSVFFGISNSGETPELLRLVNIAKESGCQTIGLSRFGSNSLSNSVDISLHHVRAPEAQFRSAASSSLFAQFLTIDLIFYAYVSKYYDDSIQKIVRSRNSVLKYQ